MTEKLGGKEGKNLKTTFNINNHFDFIQPRTPSVKKGITLIQWKTKNFKKEGWFCTVVLIISLLQAKAWVGILENTR